MGRYNFDFEVSAKGWGKSEVIIYEKGMVYISRATVKRLGLSGVKLRWGEDKANKVLALKEDPNGRAISEKSVTNLHCPTTSLGGTLVGTTSRSRKECTSSTLPRAHARRSRGDANL